MILVTTRQYEKKAKKFFQNHTQLKQKYRSVVARLTENFRHPSLKLHRLKGNLSEFLAVSLDYKYRIVLLIEIVQDQIILVDIGSHDEVY